jgi:hypothetical protein
MIVYFDTNVFDHCEQLNGVNEWDLFRIRRAVKHGCIRVIVGYLNIEETLFIVSSQPKRAEARVKLIFELGDRDLVVRSCKDILDNAFRSYANSQPLQSPFEALKPQLESELWSFVAPIAANDQRRHKRFINKTSQIKQEHQDFMKQARKRTMLLVPYLGRTQYLFNDFWSGNSGWLAEGLAKRRRVLEKVRRRGLSGLLKVRSVALAVGANLSLIYSHHFERRNPDSGDSRDILHAIAASGSDIFVTNDRRLERVLARIPVDGFRVMNLRAFLDWLPKWV